MSVVNPDNLPRDHMPAVFEDRLIFSPPPPIVMEPRSVGRRRGWVGGLLVFMIMLMPLSILGWLVYDQSRQIREFIAAQDSTSGAEIAQLKSERDAAQAQVAGLTVEINAWKTNGGRQNDEVSRLLIQGAEIRGDITTMLGRPEKQGFGNLPDWAGAPPVWDAEAVRILQDYNRELNALRDRVVAYRRPSTGSQGSGAIVIVPPGDQ